MPRVTLVAPDLRIIKSAVGVELTELALEEIDERLLIELELEELEEELDEELLEELELELDVCCEEELELEELELEELTDEGTELLEELEFEEELEELLLDELELEELDEELKELLEEELELEDELDDGHTTVVLTVLLQAKLLSIAWISATFVIVLLQAAFCGTWKANVTERDCPGA